MGSIPLSHTKRPLGPPTNPRVAVGLDARVVRMAKLTALDATLIAVNDHEERCWEAELHRLKRGSAAAVRGPSDHAKPKRVSFAQSPSLAGSKRSRGRLRATTSLARLLQQQGNTEEAWSTLAAIYGWFTEGWASTRRT